MNDENHLEQILHRLTPRGTGPELREQVLAAVGRGLSGDWISRWERRLGLAVAASILLGIVLSVWAARTDRQCRARLYGPPPVPKHIAELAEAVESVTNAETGRRVRQQFSAAWWSRPIAAPQSICSFPQIVNDLEIAGKEQRHETPQRDPEMDRDRPRAADRDTSDCQRDLGLDHRFTT